MARHAEADEEMDTPAQRSVVQDRLPGKDPMSEEEFMQKFRDFEAESPPRDDRSRRTGFTAFMILVLLVGGPVVSGAIASRIAFGTWFFIVGGVIFVVMAVIVYVLIGVYNKLKGWR